MSKDKPSSRIKVKSNAGNVKISHKWTIIVTFWAFVLTVLIGMLTLKSEAIGLGTAFVFLIALILIGILFDIIGIAVSTASESPFNSMAAKKIVGARESVDIIRHAQQISSFCNDVIGDIAGIVSGAMTAVIVAKIALDLNSNLTAVNLVLTGIVSALMIGGKAGGKGLAMLHNNSIVFVIGKVLYFIKHPFQKNGNA